MKTLLSLLFLCFIGSSLVGQTTYSDFEECMLKDPSFETLGYIHCQDAEDIEPVVSLELEEDLVDTALLMFIELLGTLDDQQDYLDNIGLTCEDMRIPCFTELSIPSHLSEMAFDAHIVEMENRFSIDQTTYDKTSKYIKDFESKAEYVFSYRLLKLQEYLDLAFEIKYTKAEILRDFSGYCDVAEYLLNNVPSKFCSTTSEKNGLTANESIRRLTIIKECRLEEEEDVQFLIGENETINMDFFYSCNGTLYFEVDDSYLEKDLILDVFTPSGKLIKEFKNIKLIENNEMIDLPEFSISNSVLLFTIRNSSEVILTKKIYCSK